MSSGNDAQGPGSDETALAQIASDAFTRQQEVYNPIIKKYSAMADDTATTRNRVAGSSNVATQQAFGQVTPGAVSSALRRGGSVGGTLAGLQGGKEQAQAAGQAGAVSRAKDVQLSELGQIIGFGRGQATQATTGLGQVAQMQTNQELQNAQLASNQNAQLGEAALGLGGLGYGAFRGTNTPAGPPTGTSKYNNPASPSAAGDFGDGGIW